MVTRTLAIAVLFTASLSGMDQYKEQLFKYFDSVRTCNAEHIRTIPTTTLKEHPLEFFNIALECSNAHEVFTAFDKQLKKDTPTGNNYFAHDVNDATRKKNGIKENYFLKKIIEQGKYR